MGPWRCFREAQSADAGRRVVTVLCALGALSCHAEDWLPNDKPASFETVAWVTRNSLSGTIVDAGADRTEPIPSEGRSPAPTADGNVEAQLEAVRSGDQILLTIPAGLAFGDSRARIELLVQRQNAWVPVVDRVVDASHSGYYLDGEFVPPRGFRGPDVSRCTQLSDHHWPATELVDAPKRVAPRSWQNDTKRFSRGLLPAVNSRVLTGELSFRIKYFPSRDCSGEPIVATVPVRVIPAPSAPAFVVTASPNQDVTVVAPRGVWFYPCGQEPRVLKRTGGQWRRLRDDRPAGRRFEGYFIDKQYQCAPPSLARCGDDECVPFGERSVDIEDEYLEIGRRIAQDHCTPHKTQQTGDVEVPVIRSQPVAAPLAVEIRYYETAACDGFPRKAIVPVSRGMKGR